MMIFIYVLIFFLGASIGSFLGMAAYRLPNHDSIISPCSHCTVCSKRIKWMHNIPIVSWILLRGKSACCGTPLSKRYVILEILSGILTLYVFIEFPLVTAVEYMVFIYALILLAEIDMEHMILPDKITKPLILYGLILNAVGSYYGIQVVSMKSSVIGLAVGYLVPWTISHVYFVLRHKKGIGGGDLKLLGATGAFMGWEAAVYTMYIGAALGIIFSIGLLMGGRGKDTMFPFGPMLVAGALTYMLLPEFIQLIPL